MMDKRLAYFLTTFVYVTAMLDKSFLEREVGFDDKLPEEIPLNELLSIQRSLCARHCHDDGTCSSFVYNNLSGKCQLFSEAILTQHGEEIVVGNVMFKKIVDGICMTAYIPDGQLLSVVGRGEGSKGYFVCDDFYHQTGLYLVCTDGVWTGLEQPCKYNGEPPYTFPPLGSDVPGRCFTVLAKTSSSVKRGTVNFKNLAGSVTFLSVLFPLDGDKIKMKSHIGGVWDTTETNLPFWPQMLGRDVNVTICAEDTLYRLYVDSVDTLTHDRRLSSEKFEKIRVTFFVVRRVMYTI